MDDSINSLSLGGGSFIDNHYASCTTENQPFLADVLAAWMLSHGSLVYIVSLFDLSKWISSDMKSQSGEIKEQLELTTHSLIRRAIEVDQLFSYLI